MKVLNWLRKFLTRNSGVMKAVRTFLQVLIAFLLDLLTAALVGVPVPAELQLAFVGIVAALLAAFMSWLGRQIPEQISVEGTD